jgi:hypothetical protein
MAKTEFNITTSRLYQRYEELANLGMNNIQIDKIYIHEITTDRSYRRELMEWVLSGGGEVLGRLMDDASEAFEAQGACHGR